MPGGGRPQSAVDGEDEAGRLSTRRLQIAVPQSQAAESTLTSYVEVRFFRAVALVADSTNLNRLGQQWSTARLAYLAKLVVVNAGIQIKIQQIIWGAHCKYAAFHMQ